MTYASHVKQPNVEPLRVWFSGSTALKKGMGLCWDRDYVTANSGETATDAFGKRGNVVALPGESNNDAFAGVLAQSYAAKTGGRHVDILLPGSVCEIAAGMDSVNGTTLMTCSAGDGDAGRFSATGFRGIGSAVAMQTTTNVLHSDFDGTAALDSTGKIIADSGATFVTSGVAIGDSVFILGVENTGSNSGTPAEYVVASVDSETQITLTAAAADGGTMQIGGYYVVSGNPTVLAYLIAEGDESGLIQWKMPPNTGHASNDTFTASATGWTFLLGGYTQGTANSRETMPAGAFGDKKAIKCMGAVTTNNIEVKFPSGSFQNSFTSGNATEFGALADIEFNAANELAVLENVGGVWKLLYSSGATVNAS